MFRLNRLTESIETVSFRSRFPTWTKNRTSDQRINARAGGCPTRDSHFATFLLPFCFLSKLRYLEQSHTPPEQSHTPPRNFTFKLCSPCPNQLAYLYMTDNFPSNKSAGILVRAGEERPTAIPVFSHRPSPGRGWGCPVGRRGFDSRRFQISFFLGLLRETLVHRDNVNLPSHLSPFLIPYH